MHYPLACVPWSLNYTYTHTFSQNIWPILNHRTKMALSSFILFSSLFEAAVFLWFKTWNLVKPMLLLPLQCELYSSHPIVWNDFEINFQCNVMLHFLLFSNSIFFVLAVCLNKRDLKKRKYRNKIYTCIYNCNVCVPTQSIFLMYELTQRTERRKWDEIRRLNIIAFTTLICIYTTMWYSVLSSSSVPPSPPCNRSCF